jgi:hypothetical protein
MPCFDYDKQSLRVHNLLCRRRVREEGVQMTTLRGSHKGDRLTLECGCGCHLEGKDELCLSIEFLLHLEAAHPEIEEPTVELAEEKATSMSRRREEL